MNMSNIYIIKFNNIIYGCYDNIELAEDFILSCINCNFIKDYNNIIILVYKKNTNIILEHINFKNELLENKNELFENKNELLENKNELFEDKNELFEDKNELFENKNELFENKNEKELVESDTDSESTTYSEYNRRNIIEISKRKEMDLLNLQKIDYHHQINLLKLEKKKLEENEILYNYDLKLYYQFKNELNNNNNFKIPILFIDKYNIFKNLDIKNKLCFDDYNELYEYKGFKTEFDNEIPITESNDKINTDIKKIVEHDDNLYNKSNDDIKIVEYNDDSYDEINKTLHYYTNK